MADYKEKFDDLHRAAQRKAREIDEKFGVKGFVEDTARVAGDAAKLGAKTIASGAEQLRAEAERFAEDNNLREHRRARRATERAEQRRADILGHLALKFNPLSFGFG